MVKLPAVEAQPAPAVPEFALKPAVVAQPAVVVPSEPVKIAAVAVATSQPAVAELVAEPKRATADDKQPVAFSLPLLAYYRGGALPYSSQAQFRLSPYSFGFPFTTGNYVYAL